MAPERRHLPHAARLTRATQLDAVRLKGKRVRTEMFEVRYLASLLRHPRVGLVVPKHSHNSVERNVVKRRLRELLRLEFLPHLGPVDVVMRAAPAAYGASYEKLRDAALRARDAMLMSGAS